MPTAPSFSPDGSMSVFVSQHKGNRDIFSMNANGANVLRLTTDAAADIRPSWGK
jgi:Tol biopolymer transport system component